MYNFGKEHVIMKRTVVLLSTTIGLLLGFNILPSSAGFSAPSDAPAIELRQNIHECLTPELVEQIRMNPPQVTTAFTECADELRGMFGAKSTLLNDDDLYAIFVSLVAYEMAPYGPSAGSDLDDLLQQPYLNCRTYALLASYFFLLNQPVVNKIAFSVVGWDGGAVGNHAQIFVTDRGSGQSLLLDPTIALVAFTGFYEVTHAYPLAPDNIVDLSSRTELEQFRSRVVSALEDGSYQFSDLIYYLDRADRYVEFESDTDPGPTGSLLVNGGLTLLRTGDVILFLVGADYERPIYGMRVANTNDLERLEWQPYTHMLGWRLDVRNNQSTVYVQYLGESGRVSDVYSETVRVNLPPAAPVLLPLVPIEYH